MIPIIKDGVLTVVRPILPVMKGRHRTDQAQADFATKFICCADPGTLTEAYRNVFKAFNACSGTNVSNEDIVLVMASKCKLEGAHFTMIIGNRKHNLTIENFLIMKAMYQMVEKKPVFLFRGAHMAMSSNEKNLYNAFTALLSHNGYKKCGKGSDMLWVWEVKHEHYVVDEGRLSLF